MSDSLKLKKYIGTRNYWPSGKYFLKDGDGLLLAIFEIPFFGTSIIKVIIQNYEYELVGRDILKITQRGITLAELSFASECSRNSGTLRWNSHSLSFKPKDQRSKWSFLKGSYCSSFSLEQDAQVVGSIRMPNITRIFSGKAQWDREIWVPQDWPIFVICLLFYACGIRRDS